MRLFSRRSPSTDAPALRPLTSARALRQATQHPRWLVFKHSPTCPLSATAHREMRRLVSNRREIPVYIVDVIRDRRLSEEIAARFDVWHHSPQVIVFEGSTPTWHGSHGAITEDTVGRMLDQTQ